MCISGTPNAGQLSGSAATACYVTIIVHTAAALFPRAATVQSMSYIMVTAAVQATSSHLGGVPDLGRKLAPGPLAYAPVLDRP